MKDPKTKFNRHTVLVMFLAFFIIAMIVRLVDLQIIKGQEYYDRINDVISKNVELAGERGAIFDRNGEALAFNVKTYDAVLYYRRRSNAALNEDILKIYKLLSGNNEEVETGFGGYIAFDPIGYGEKLSTKEEIDKWLNELIEDKKAISDITSAADVFEYFKTRKFYISEDYSDEDIYRIMSVRYGMIIKGYSQLTPYILAKNIEEDTVARIEALKNDLPGLYTEERHERRYICSEAFSSITGYVRAIETEEVEDYLDQGYGLNELVGKDGLEKSYEKYLRAQSGIQIRYLEPGQAELNSMEPIRPVAGFDLMTSVDASVQQTAYDSLAKNIEKIVSERDDVINFGDTKYGAAVMVDVNNGEIIALSSYPGYDPNAFVTNDMQQIDRIMESTDLLQLNRAIQGLYPPGSAFKPLTAIAAIEEGIYAPGDLITDDGVINYDGMDFYGMEYKKYGITYGDIDLEYALAVSANVFFYKIGVATGIDMLDKWAKNFGLGEKTGIDIGGELQGRRNSRTTMKEIEPDRSWGRADTAQASIGQLYNQFTPLQIARYIAAVANGGKLYIPHIVTGVYKRDGSKVVSFESEYIDTLTSPVTLREVQKGMLAVSNETDGSAVDIFSDFPYGKVAGKTGTPETGREAEGTSSHSVFVCYAPYDKPEVAVCVIIENGVWGANAAPVAYDMLIEYFRNRDKDQNK